jgi:hypothetical protein
MLRLLDDPRSDKNTGHSYARTYQSVFYDKTASAFAVYRETEPHEHEIALFLSVPSSDKFDADLKLAVVHLFGFAVIITQKHKNLLMNHHGGFQVPIHHT